ncbi:hypothetical protein [Streptomyces sp. H27-D2]|uniref:hypothetical protein n=1 Tax=Streptomyces sp. H27-D2 TaxID=3046304 RepID=UPI002DBD4406|nr:hypothetical protein [Streptomyces sp. H27-D2]MEC4020235.1 hypothetical protein [Streptomyces sp. H27-D2]
MPDIVVDYELLNDVAKKARSLKDQVQAARESKQEYATEEVGAGGVSSAILAYYSIWKGSFKRSEEKLEKLGGLYEGVAKGWADWDFRLAGQAGKQEASLAADLYKTQKEIWDDWQKQVADGTVDPNDPHAPKPPGERPGEWTTDDGHGNTTTTSYEYGADGKPTKISTTIHTNTGLTATDTSNYHPDGTYDSTATDVYGNVTTTTGNSQVTESGDDKTTKDYFSSVTKSGDGKESTTTGTTTSVYDSITGHRDSGTTYTTVGPDEDGEQGTVQGTTHSSVDIGGHEVNTTIEVKEDGSGTKTTVTDGRTEEWTSSTAGQDSGWEPSEDED